MNGPLWTAQAAAAATGGKTAHEWAATGVSIDSRTVGSGALFVAIEGPSFDGHDFVAKALAAGASAAMVHRAPKDVGKDAPLLTVGETLKALGDLGVAARTRSPARIAAVTGSVGKTGVKEAIRLVLSAQGATEASQGNLNNHWGAPLSLSRLSPDAVYAVFELGMNHPGEIAPLTRMVRPHVALITTIAPAHTAFFSSLEEVADAKAEIFEGVEPGGTAVLNRDNAFFDHLAAAAGRQGIARILSFGAAEDATLRLVSSRPDADGTVIEADIDGRRIDYRVGAPGRHWAGNSLGVLGVAMALGADVDAAAAALAEVRAPAGRGKQTDIAVKGGSFRLIDESYNASPEAMRAAFEVLSLAEPRNAGRRIAVLGDMLELGDDAPAQHAALADDVAASNIDTVFAAGPQSAHLYRALPSRLRGGHAGDTRTLAPIVADLVRPGDVVLVKGSLGMDMAQVVRALTAAKG